MVDGKYAPKFTPFWSRTKWDLKNNNSKKATKIPKYKQKNMSGKELLIFEFKVK